MSRPSPVASRVAFPRSAFMYSVSVIFRSGQLVSHHFSISESKSQAYAKLAFANLNHMDNVRTANLRKLISDSFGGSQTALSSRTGISLSQLGQYLGGYRNMGEKTARKIEQSCGKPPGWLDLPPNQKVANYIELEPADKTVQESFPIEYWDARGSCGGGSLIWESEVKGKLVKESSWFRKYGIKPADALVVYADGDSMADFIVDGDIVIFDRSKTTPKSGQIFLIEHPDGLRIKQLRREIDGTWVLESRNPDKRRYPDERITTAHSDLLLIKGEFVYRQGG